jgi:hypothetical protein
MGLAASFVKAIDENNVNYIFLKRDEGNHQMLPLSIKRTFCIFVLLDKFIGGEELLSEMQDFWKQDSTEDAELNGFYSLQYSPEVTPDYMPKHLASITKPIPMKEWTIAIFSETFFSNNPALDTASVMQIVNCCRLVTIKHPKLIICINFLHKYKGLMWCPAKQTPENPSYIKNVEQSSLLANSGKEDRFSNYSLVIWNGVVLSCYRKTVYLAEQNSLISQKYGFDFGDWNSSMSTELSSASPEHNALAELFNVGKKQVVCTRICADMTETPPILPNIKLLIIQANDPPVRINWLGLIKSPTKCCMVDSITSGMFEMIGGGKYSKFEVVTCPFVKDEVKCTIEVWREQK